MPSRTSSHWPRGSHARGALAIAALLALASTGCNGKASPASAASSAAGDVQRPAGWVEDSHGNDAKPNYDAVFPTTQVKPLTVTIAASDWQAMLADMTNIYGARGTAGSTQGGPGGMPPGGRPDGAASGPGGQPPAGFDPTASGGARPDFGASGAPGGMGGPGGGMSEPETNPMWSKATIDCNSQTWTTVGVRFKGNSSLSSAWRSGTDVLPLKLDFDQWEDDHPEIKNQRFYGFKSVSLSTNWGDATSMRDTLVAKLLQDVGLVAPKTGFYDVTLDHGSGKVDLGVYTMVEEIDDTVIPEYFKKDDGNVYKPDGNAASLAAGTSAQIPTVFQKENNKKDADWSDVQKLYAVLNDAKRTTDADGWRKDLEKVFDVDTFLHVLAVLAVAGDWDSYGQMAHNYYLYDDPATKKLTWIAWDHNLALSAQGGVGGMGGGMNVSIDKKDVTASWPLIRYLLDQPTYHAKYVGFVKSTLDGPFQQSKLASEIQGYQSLLNSYAAKQAGASTFTSAVASLNGAIQARLTAAQQFLTSNPQ